MAHLYLILNDQLSFSLPSLKKANYQKDHFVFIEAQDEFKAVKHHKKKLVLIFSAMRHFAQELEKKVIRRNNSV